MAKKPIQPLQDKAPLEFEKEISAIIQTMLGAYDIYYQYHTANKSGLKLISLLKGEALLYLYFYEFQKTLEKIMSFTRFKNGQWFSNVLYKNVVIPCMDIQHVAFIFNLRKDELNDDFKAAKGQRFLGCDETFEEMIEELHFLRKILYRNYSSMNFVNDKNELIIGPINKPEKKKRSKNYS